MVPSRFCLGKKTLVGGQNRKNKKYMYTNLSGGPVASKAMDGVPKSMKPNQLLDRLGGGQRCSHASRSREPRDCAPPLNT